SDYTGQFAFVGDAGDKDKLYVAVLDFNVSGMDQAWGKVAKSLLVQWLNKTGKFRTFDRSGTVRNIAEEFHLQGSELMEDSVVKQLKRMYSVDGFVAGEIISLGGQYFISLKLVETTSEIKTANLDFSTAQLSPDDLRARMPGLAAQLTGAQEVASIAPTRVFSGKYTLTVRSNVIGDKV
ncbi:MAG: hypothetical protein GY809_30385, partial [Planctomycetes bacterium]|nr:hypothetical protein [Planctomycetota bacterium]